jgi:hypothetical protein
MIVMFFCESALEAQRSDTRAAANKSKNKTICLPLVTNRPCHASTLTLPCFAESPAQKRRIDARSRGNDCSSRACSTIAGAGASCSSGAAADGSGAKKKARRLRCMQHTKGNTSLLE